MNISQWVSEFSGTQTSMKKKIELSAEQKELEMLRKENKRLKMEREILKKAAVNSTGQRNTESIFSAGDKNCNVFLGLSLSSFAMRSKSF